MLLTKYMTQHRRGSPEIVDRISNEVNYFFNCENVNESGIKILKQRIENISKDLSKFPTAVTPLNHKRSALPSLRTAHSPVTAVAATRASNTADNDNDRLSIRSDKLSVGS